MEQFCNGLKCVLDLVESNPERLVDGESFLYVASMLYVRVVLVLTSAFEREKETEEKYADIQDVLVEILDWTQRLYCILFLFAANVFFLSRLLFL